MYLSYQIVLTSLVSTFICIIDKGNCEKYSQSPFSFCESTNQGIKKHFKKDTIEIVKFLIIAN